MNDRLRMLASRYYSGVCVTSIDCLTKYRIHAHNFLPIFFYMIKYKTNHPNHYCWLGNLIDFFFVKLANLTQCFCVHSIFCFCRMQQRSVLCIKMHLK